MKTLLKWTLGTLAILLVLLAVLVTYILFGLDPNSYKPQLQDLAEAQGVDLQIEGDLSWQLFPNLAIKIGATRLASERHNLPNSRFRTADLSLDWLPLFSGRIAVNGIHVTGADLELKEAAQGASVAALPATATEPATLGDSSFSLAVREFSLKDSRVLLPGESGAIELGNLQLDGTQLNFDGIPFPVNLHSDIRMPGTTEALGVDFSGSINVNLKTQAVLLKNTRIAISGLAKDPLQLAFDADTDLAADSSRITDLQGSLGPLAFSGELAIAGLSTAPEATGKIQVPAFNLKQFLTPWLEEPLKTRNAEAMARVGFSSSFSASASRVSLPDMVLNLDESRIDGKFELVMAKSRKLQLVLRGDSINVDSYLAPEVADEAAASPAAADAALFLPLVAPLALLDGGAGTVELSWNKMLVEQIPLTDLQVALAGNSKQLKLTRFTTGVFGGTASATASLDLGQATPSLKLQQNLTGIQLQNALTHLAENADMTGTLTMDLNATTSGNSVENLRANLKGGGMLRIEEPVLQSINIEQNYCDLAAMVEKQPARTEPWPAGTRLNTMDGRYQLAGNRLLLEQFNTGIGNLLVRGSGVIDTEAETFDIRLITNLQGERTSDAGCVVKSKRIRNKDITMHCKDSFAKAGGTSCKPDEAVVKNLIQDRVLDEIREKSGNKDTVDAVEGLLRGILGGGSK